MRWAIKHKSGRTLFVTSDEFIANNRRKMGWIVEEVMMTSRAQFEKFAADRLGLSIAMIFDARNGDRYLHAFDSMNIMQPLNGWWTIWQASRAEIEIELPEEESFGCTTGYYAEDVIDVIENAGLKVKK